MEYGYQIDFEEVLLPDWEAWDGNGISDIPGKTVTLQDGSTGCIILNSEGISVYSVSLDRVNNSDPDTDEGSVFLEHANNKEDAYLLESYLTEKDLEEAFIVYDKFMVREDSYVPRNRK